MTQAFTFPAYSRRPVELRRFDVNGVEIVAYNDGGNAWATIDGDRRPTVEIIVADAVAKPRHSHHKMAIKIAAMGRVAYLDVEMPSRQHATITLTDEQYALGDAARAAYADYKAAYSAAYAKWDVESGAVARRARADAYDGGMNEGGEGFNPHRTVWER